jgi:hypothetical protein
MTGRPVNSPPAAYVHRRFSGAPENSAAAARQVRPRARRKEGRLCHRCDADRRGSRPLTGCQTVLDLKGTWPPPSAAPFLASTGKPVSDRALFIATWVRIAAMVGLDRVLLIVRF